MKVEDFIVESVARSLSADFSEQSLHEAKRRIIDSFGVALASVDSQPSATTLKAMRYFEGTASAFGGLKVSPDMAAFYNTLLIRYLDFNDTYLSKEPLHPSDMLGALLSLGSLYKLKGSDVMRAMLVGYEIGTRLCDSTSLRAKGYDHVNFLQIATVAALCSLLKLDKEITLQALGISIIPNVALRQSRVGNLSMWKAGAAADASRNAAFSVILARNGFTGPSDPISGEKGFRNEIARDMHFDTSIPNFDAILETYVKKYPVEYHAQAAVEAALRLSKGVRRQDIKKIVIQTYEAGMSILADKEKWNPENKETADHSLPFCVSAAFVFKDFDIGVYSHIKDSRIRSLMRVTDVEELGEYTRMYPEELPTKIKVYTRAGVFENEVAIPRGHSKNRITDSEIDEKFISLTNDKRLLETLWSLDNKEVDKLVKLT